MSGYWITFQNGDAGYCEGDNAVEAAKTAAALRQQIVSTCKSLPYPAKPIIAQTSNCPPFCYKPRECQGRTACPQRYACSE